MKIFKSLEQSPIVQNFEVLDYTYPHHKHAGETVTESFEISLGDVLAYIVEYRKENG